MFLIIISCLFFIYSIIIFITGNNYFFPKNNFVKEEFYPLYNRFNAIDLIIYITSIDFLYFTDFPAFILLLIMVLVPSIIYIYCKKKGMFY